MSAFRGRKTRSSYPCADGNGADTCVVDGGRERFNALLKELRVIEEGSSRDGTPGDDGSR